MRSVATSPALRQLPQLLLLLALVGCAPGSGGTGVPDGTSTAPPPSAVPSPTPAPPPAAGLVPAPDVPATPDLCAAPPEADTAPYVGTIRALANDCLLVGDRSFLIRGALVVRRSGAYAQAADLVAGLRVTIEPAPDDPGLARVITIEDAD